MNSAKPATEQKACELLALGKSIACVDETTIDSDGVVTFTREVQILSRLGFQKYKSLVISSVIKAGYDCHQIKAGMMVNTNGSESIYIWYISMLLELTRPTECVVNKPKIQ